MSNNVSNQYSSFFEHGGFFQSQDVLYEVSGEKSAALLHGQLTNHIKGLKPGEANYNLLLTQKGRVAGDLFVYCLPDRFILAVNPLFEEKIVAHLKKLAPLSKVEIKKLEDSGIIHICFPSSFPLPRVGGVTRKAHDPCGTRGADPGQGEGKQAFPVNRIGFPGYDLFVPSGPWVPSEKNLVKMNSELIEILRIEQGIPKIGIDVTEDNLPQEGRVERALHFDKGCYLGQEIVARLQYRGHVNKILVGLMVRHAHHVLPGHPELVEGCLMTSCIFSPKLNAPLALGYVPYNSNPTNLVKLPLNN